MAPMSFFRRIPWIRSGRIRECLAILPVIRTQLTETSSHVEDAVVKVCANFTGIATRARETVSETSKLLEGAASADDASVESSIDASRRTISGLLDRMERAAKLSAMAVARMEEVSLTVVGIEELLAQVERIAFTNKVVALNAKIEAVHVGALGSGFEVVADEISRQAERSSGLAGNISERIQTMRARVDGAVGELREFLAEDRAELDQSRAEAESALNILWALHQRSRESLAHSVRENATLADEIAEAIVGLQFQDRVKQRVAHVIEALETAEQALAGRTESLPQAGLLAGVEAAYTMESERSAHQRAAGTASKTQDMEVELF